MLTRLPECEMVQGHKGSFSAIDLAMGLDIPFLEGREDPLLRPEIENRAMG